MRGTKYDEACKTLFRNKEVLAPILQIAVPEYKDCSIQEIINCIEGDISSTETVSDIPSNLSICGCDTEYASVSDKLIRYDVHFVAINPKYAKNKTQKKSLKFLIHIDLEVQNNYNVRYPIPKRAVYYCARELSAQLGRVTETTDYDDLAKVYSIWICNENIPKNEQNTVSRYHIVKEDQIGEVKEKSSDYDLLEIILIRRGGDSRNEDIFDYLSAVFDGNLNKLEDYIPDVQENEKIKREVVEMCGLGESLIKQGIEQGIEQGKMNTYFDLVHKNILSAEVAAVQLNMPVDEFAKKYKTHISSSGTTK